MFKKLIWIIFTLVIGVPTVVLAVANRQPVKFILDPFSPQNPVISAPELPLFVYLFAMLFIGLVLGGLATWIGQSNWRKTARQRTREAHQWRTKADQLSRQLDLSQQPQLPAK